MLFNVALFGCAQNIINLPFEKSNEVQWEGDEKEYFSDIWNTQLISNVSAPAMEVFQPDPAIANGTSIIVAPGGALYALSIDSEGKDVAKWLNKKGITAFVLKYRLVPTQGDAVAQLQKDGDKVEENAKQVLPLAVDDGLNAISYVRKNAAKLKLDSNKIGFMGFSAGGAVTMGVLFNSTENNKPNFIVPVYAWMSIIPSYNVPENAPPLLVVCASDDPHELAPLSVDLYSAWLKAGKIAELHMYSKGGHGFGMRNQNLPSDKWIDRFYDWFVAEGFTGLNQQH